MNNKLKDLYESTIVEKFSETGTAQLIQKWMKKNNVVIVNQEFTNAFIYAKSLQYSQYLQLVQWCLDNNVVVVNKKISDEMKNAFLKTK